MISSDDRQHLNRIIAQFFEAPVTAFPEAFGSGHINDTYRFSYKIDKSARNFILQKINSDVFPTPEFIMKNIETVAHHLQQTSYPRNILTPVLTKNGASFFKTETSEYWRIFPFFENTVAYDKVENENQAYEAAKAFGEYLSHLKDLPLSRLKTTIPNFHNGTYRLKKFKTALQKANTTLERQAKNEINFIQKNMEFFARFSCIKFPLRVTHNDTKINNILFEKHTEKPLVVIDLDTIMPGIIMSDFGDMVRTFTNSFDEDEPDTKIIEARADICQAVKNGFLSATSNILTPLERAHLHNGAKWIILMQIIRFLTDFLENNIYYKTDYPTHNLVRTRNQIALFNSFQNQF